MLCFRIRRIEAWTWCTCWTRPSALHAPLALGQVGQASLRGGICTPRKAEEAGSARAQDPACPVKRKRQDAQGSFIIIRSRGCTHTHISHILLTPSRGRRNVCFISQIQLRWQHFKGFPPPTQVIKEHPCMLRPRRGCSVNRNRSATWYSPARW